MHGTDKTTLKEILLILVIFLCGTIRAQETTDCADIVVALDTMAIYKHGSRGILEFFKTNVSGSIDSCYKNENRMISKFEMFMTIDCNGKVISAYVKRPLLPMHCRTRIQQAFMQMEGWTAARHKGQFVSSNITFPIYIEWR